MKQKQIWIFLFLYALSRIFSYFFQPETPLHGPSMVNTVVSTLILISTIYLLWKKDERGWYIVALEMILGGSGGYLAVGSLSLRTLLLGTSLLIYSVQQISNFKFLISNARRFLFPFILIIWVGISALRGYFAGHNLSLIISDTIPYFFFLYYFPLRDLLNCHSDRSAAQWRNLANTTRDSSTEPALSERSESNGVGMTTGDKFKQLCTNAILAAIIGNFALIIITFIGYSSGLLVLQDSYYHWYRDVALGKITELPFHFYRLVLNEHLLLVPVLLWLLRRVIASPDTSGRGNPLTQGVSKRWDRYVAPLLAMTLLIVLSLNLTRIYLLALAVGMLFLFTRQNWKRWLAISISTLVFFVFSFTSIHLIASRGQSLGWEIFGVRLQSIVSPGVEDSSLSRMLLLPKIVEKIRQNPILGNGLGDTATVYSPIFKTDITTPHFDWGYLEILVELGLIGLIIWTLIIGNFLSKLQSQPRWQLASFGALMMINLTSPALFHVLGIIWIAILSANCASLKQSLSSSDNL